MFLKIMYLLYMMGSLSFNAITLPPVKEQNFYIVEYYFEESAPVYTQAYTKNIYIK